MLKLLTFPILLYRLLEITIIDLCFSLYLEVLGVIVYSVRGPEIYRLMMETDPNKDSKYTWSYVCKNLLRRWWFNGHPNLDRRT